ncbi:polysaccharide pyruvyl transferase family protein [Microbulbifer halophilus]|uniref:Polysaccharide pyruvyl transferase family protein n=1 Tax=Microbulbifer halophilus TaxID=453963 RepID=A0ABW5EFZ1_9GAMM|nr:polysaccharide pyruvyl transferase family protein [Microbulbifer halophilus]MCW8128361.1 polysaccharide pyruvyl transferase family protein [Microbulbifer halophilus]
MFFDVKNQRGDECWLRLAQDINSLSSGGIYFVPAAGNYGDALINIGSRQFFSKYSIDYVELDRKEILSGRLDQLDPDALVILGGGGAFCNNFSSSHQLAKKVSGYFRQVLILPTTYELSRIDANNIIYYRRDNLGSSEVIEDSKFCHDMAFFIELELDVPNFNDRVWRLYAMRADKEGHGLDRLFESNFDLSKIGDATYTNPKPFFRVISNFKVIVTDRMHIAIAASMLQLDCYLVVGNYFKSRDVFKSSIEAFYPKTKLLTVADFLKRFG